MPISINSTDNWVGMPDWLAEAGVEWYPSTKVAECMVPVWEYPIFLAKMDQLVSALAERYSGNPHLEFIDCRTFGNWGEWHLGMVGGNEPSDEIKRSYIEWARFDKTQVIVPISGGTGMRQDAPSNWFPAVQLRGSEPVTREALFQPLDGLRNRHTVQR